MNKKIYLGLLSFIISVVVFIYILNKVLDEKTIDMFYLLSPWLLFVMLFTALVQLFLNSLNQQVLLKVYAVKISLQNLYLHNIISSMYTLVIPGYFAPDFYLGFHYGREQNDFPRIISALFLSRVIGFLTFIILAVMAILYMGQDMWEQISVNVNPLIYISDHIILLILLLLIFLVLILVFRKYKSKLNNKYQKITEIWAETKGKHEIFIHSFLIRILFMIVGVSGRIALGIMLGVEIEIFKLAAIILILNLLVSLPISFNGVGVREAGYVGLLSMFGVPKEIAFLFSIAEFGVTLFSGLIGFMTYLILKILKK